MKMVTKVLLTAAAIAALAAPAMAADKLVVKNAGGTADVFKVTDGGKLGVNVANPVYPVDTAQSGATPAKTSILHFAYDGADSGGWLTSVSPNNFFVSSGAVYDLPAGGWIQKSADGMAIWAGSGAAGFSIFTNSGAAVGSVIAGTPRVRVDYSGNMGIATTAPKSKLHVVGLPTYADNAAALAGGLTAGAFYRTATGVLMVTY